MPNELINRTRYNKTTPAVAIQICVPSIAILNKFRFYIYAPLSSTLCKATPAVPDQVFGCFVPFQEVEHISVKGSFSKQAPLHLEPST